MIQMIEFTALGDKPILINLCKVTEITGRTDGYTCIRFSANDYVQVREPYEEVREMIGKAIKQTPNSFLFWGWGDVLK